MSQNTHIMHLAEEPFNWIKQRKKCVEVRLYDEKRQKINLGDIIIFRKINSNEEIRARVKGLFRFQTFKDLFSFMPKQYLAHDNLSLEDQVARMRKYYTEEEEEKYGILAIWFEIVE